MKSTYQKLYLNDKIENLGRVKRSLFSLVKINLFSIFDLNSIIAIKTLNQANSQYKLN